jgi:hypothetical protein
VSARRLGDTGTPLVAADGAAPEAARVPVHV